MGSTVSKVNSLRGGQQTDRSTLNVQTSQTKDQNYGVQQSNNRTNHNQRNYREQARPGAVITYHTTALTCPSDPVREARPFGYELMLSMMSTIIWGTKSGPAGARAQCCNCLQVRLVNGDNLMGESTLSNGMLAVTALYMKQR